METYFTAEAGKQLHDDCTTVILPCVSIGNVGQLAVDMMIRCGNANRIGFLDDPFILPCVGNDAYGPLPLGDLSTPLEVYEDRDSNLTIIQQRSPVMKGMLLKFSRNISSWANDAGKKEIIILTSLDSGKMPRCEIKNQEIQYISSTNTDGTDERCEKLGWKRLEMYDPSGRGWKHLEAYITDSHSQSIMLQEDQLTDDDYLSSLPFASVFYNCKARGLKVTCLFCFCSEGDNIQEAFLLTEAAYMLIGRFPSAAADRESMTQNIPLSWMSVYGPPLDSSIF